MTGSSSRRTYLCLLRTDGWRFRPVWGHLLIKTPLKVRTPTSELVTKVCVWFNQVVWQVSGFLPYYISPCMVRPLVAFMGLVLSVTTWRKMSSIVFQIRSSPGDCKETLQMYDTSDDASRLHPTHARLLTEPIRYRLFPSSLDGIIKTVKHYWGYTTIKAAVHNGTSLRQ